MWGYIDFKPLKYGFDLESRKVQRIDKKMDTCEKNYKILSTKVKISLISINVWFIKLSDRYSEREAGKM